MTSRGGRDRFRRDHPPKFEDKPHSGRANPPSRHLWVGNLSHSIAETDLTEHFLRFGELDTVAFQPGRSYAFINFKQEEDAIAAITSLKGSPIAGKPLRIEFAKADKSSASEHDEEYLPRRDEQRSGLRGSPFSQRDSRARHVSPVPFYPEKSTMSDTSAETEPSEVLWIGFPSLLKVDDVILKKAFSPFGEIEKITAFPGRSYAFVRFKNLMSACRAKETLQGKLFGNPRVNICFAKSEAGSSNSGRSSMNAPLPPHFKSNSRPESSENFQQDRTYGGFTGNPRIRSPKFGSNLDFEDYDGYGFSRKGSLRTGENNEFEHWWFGDVDSELGLPPGMYEKPSSPTRERGANFPDVSQKIPQKGPFFEDKLDLPEDAYFFHGAKKLKTSSYSSEKELPDYPLSDLEQEKRALPRLSSDFPQPEGFDKNFESRSFGYKQTPDHPMNLNPCGERSDPWRASHDRFRVGSGSLPSNPIGRKRFPPESDQSSLNEWKWEGTIAKGGTPVCRARCFPVGKVMDILLPEFLDCTARTGLDMLAKHYYQAASAWVVFFVPESDADMGFYNEFMHYLGEKQRAAVAKLDDKTTLFLVPPSDFSEKVLKVPGKLSISGVVLRLEHPGSNFGSLHHPHERKDTNLSFHGDASYPKPSTPWGPYPTNASLQDLSKSGVGNVSFLGNAATPAPPVSFSGSAHATESISNSYNENRHEYPLHQQNSSSGSSWPPHPLQNSVSGLRNIPSQVSDNVTDPTIQEHHRVIPMALQETSSGHYTGGISCIPFSGNSGSSFQETQPSVPLSMPVAALQPEQLAQLASSLLGKQRESSNTPNASMGEDFRRTNTMNQSDYLFGTSQRYALPNNHVTSELSTSQFTQGPQFQQQQQTSNLPSVPQTTQGELQTVIQENQQLQSTGTQEAEADPQKRLQATLQLAAALLQQIQQGKGT